MGGMAPGQMYSSPIRAPNQRTAMNEVVYSPNRETRKCKAMIEGGWCPFGDSCEFIHPTDFNLHREQSLYNNFQNQNNYNNFKQDTVSINMSNGGNYSPETVNTQFQMDTMVPFSSQHPQQINEMMMALATIKNMNSSTQLLQGGEQHQGGGEHQQAAEQVFELPIFSPPAGNCFSESVNSWNNKVLQLKNM